MDKMTGQSRRFGFVIFSQSSGIEAAVKDKDNHYILDKWVDAKKHSDGEMKGMKGKGKGKDKDGYGPKGGYGDWGGYGKSGGPYGGGYGGGGSAAASVPAAGPGLRRPRRAAADRGRSVRAA